MTMVMHDEYTKGYERGLNAGWDDANYADAYQGGRTTSVERQAEASLEKRFGDVTEFFRWGWHTGYEQGVERFESDQYVDGTPVASDV